MKKMPDKHKQNQQGIVSLIVTLILIMIMTVIVISFGNFSRREQVETFEQQLSTEAFYAAESGVNTAINEIKNANSIDDILRVPKEDCQTNPAPAPGPGASYPNFEYNLEPTGTVAISCLLVDPAPYSLEISSAGVQEPYVFPLEREDGSDLNQVSIFWHDKEAAPHSFTGCSGSDELPQSWYGNCTAGMLKIDLVPVDGSFSFNELATRQKTFYVKPRQGGGGVMSFNGTTTGEIVTGRCTNGALSAQDPKHCRLRINGLNEQKFYIRVTPLYLSASITMCSNQCAGNSGQTYRLIGAQAKIDSTGRASGVLRRIQVHVDISGLNDNAYTPNAIESRQDICKQFSIDLEPGDPLGAAGCSIP